MAHRRWIRREGGSDEVADALAKGDLSNAPVSDQDRAILTYAGKLALQPGTIVEQDIDALRRAGFDDAAIGDTAIIAALFAFMNRVVDGLRCEVPPEMEAEARRAGISPAGPPAERPPADSRPSSI